MPFHFVSSLSAASWVSFVSVQIHAFFLSSHFFLLHFCVFIFAFVHTNKIDYTNNYLKPLSLLSLEDWL